MRVIDILAAPWAIMQDRLDEITRIYSTHLRGEKIDVDAIEAQIGAPLGRKEQGYDIRNGVAVVPMDGVISKKMNLFSRISGGASTQLIERDFLEALEDPNAHSIILHADTPGGSVDGTSELAETIFNARGRKPIYTLADGLMASAGVWIGSAADKVYMTSDTTGVGSIGVVTQHIDYSERNRKAGIAVTEIFAGKYKRIAGENQPLTEEGRDYLQSQVDYLYSIFVNTVAKHRGVTPSAVLERMAEGRMFIGEQAIDAGLVDGVSTLDQLVEMLADDGGRLRTLAGAARENVSPETAISINNHEESVMDLNELKEKHPELFQAAYDEGHAAGLDEGSTKGAKGERDRIQSVRAQSMPGHEALIQTLMFDGETTGPQAAVAVLAAEKEARKASDKARTDDASELDVVTPSIEDGAAPAKDANLTEEEKVKAAWDGDADLRADFGGNFDRYQAYAKAKGAGRMKVLGGKD